jgi:hypothetical protein
VNSLTWDTSITYPEHIRTRKGRTHASDEKPPVGYARTMAKKGPTEEELRHRRELGAWLRSLRVGPDERKPLFKQGDIARACKKDQGWVSLVETSDRPPFLELHDIRAWAEACGHTFATVLDGEPTAPTVARPPTLGPDMQQLVDAAAELDPPLLDMLRRTAVALTAAPSAIERLRFEIKQWEDEVAMVALATQVAEIEATLNRARTGDRSALDDLRSRVKSKG